MSVRRRLLFSLVTLAIFLGVVEAGCRLAWLRLEARAFQVRTELGEQSLKTNAINFILQSDPILGFVLKPGLAAAGINIDGFAQRQIVPIGRDVPAIRIVAMGESTTHGHSVDTGNYPLYLRHLVAELAAQGKPVEMINAGVSGWMSDQVALWAEHKVAAYRPDLVVFYAGWNDFQSYDPYRAAPTESIFDKAFGNPFRIESDFAVKTVLFAVAGYEAALAWLAPPRAPPALPRADGYAASADENYRFLFKNLDRAVAAFKKINPGTRFAVSTLVGRWPDELQADYETILGRTWWMTQRSLDQAAAALTLQRLNQAIRDYARQRELVLIDAELAYAPLDRSMMQTDFAHMTDTGYELLANVMYDALRKDGLLQGPPSPRLSELLAKYDKVAQPTRQK